MACPQRQQIAEKVHDHRPTSSVKATAMTGELHGVAEANALTMAWARTVTSEHVVISGAGVWPLLVLLAAGADGVGREDLEKACRLDGDQGVASAHGLLKTFNFSAATRLAIAAWARADLPLSDWWLAAIGSDLRLSGDPVVDQANLDAWAFKHTDGLIPGMPIKVKPSTLLLLASALSIRTKWVKPFDAYPCAFVAQEGPWSGQELAGLSGSFYNKIDALALARTAIGNISVLTVAGENDVDVILLLGPDGKAGGEVLVAGMMALAKNDAAALISGSQLPMGHPGPGLTVAHETHWNSSPMLQVNLPRFSVSSHHDLMEKAEIFGLSRVAEESRGHFPRISTYPLAIDQARQDIVAHFTAEGFEAAAVTAFAVKAGAGGRSVTRKVLKLIFDRPFGFLALHRPTRLALLAGWITAPEPKR
jgi:serine protease inhibitor